MFSRRKSRLERMAATWGPAVLLAMKHSGRVAEDRIGLRRGALSKAASRGGRRAYEELSHSVRSHGLLGDVAHMLRPRHRGLSAGSIALLALGLGASYLLLNAPTSNEGRSGDAI